MPPKFSIEFFEDPTVQEDAIPGWQQKYTRMSGGHYKGHVALLDAGGLRIIREKIAGDVYMESAPNPGKVVIGIKGMDAPMTDDLRNEVIIQNDVCGSFTSSEADVGGFMIECDAARLEQWDFVKPRNCIRVVQANPQIEALRRFVHQEMMVAPRHIETIAEGYGAYLSEVLGERIAVLLDTLDRRHMRQSDPDLLAVFKAIDRFIVAHLDETLGTAVISEETGLAPRDIRAACFAATGRSIREWIMLRRLDHFHRTICGGKGRITDFALDAGFQNFGRLSQYYKEIYGQLPSKVC